MVLLLQLLPKMLEIVRHLFQPLQGCLTVFATTNTSTLFVFLVPNILRHVPTAPASTFRECEEILWLLLGLDWLEGPGFDPTPWGSYLRSLQQPIPVPPSWRRELVTLLTKRKEPIRLALSLSRWTLLHKRLLSVFKPQNAEKWQPNITSTKWWKNTSTVFSRLMYMGCTHAEQLLTASW